MTISVASVATAIAGLSPIDTTISVYDLDDFPDEITVRDTPCLMPAPVFVSNVEVIPKSLGGGSGRLVDIEYILNYRFLYETVGTGRKLQDVYQGLADKTMNIIETFITNNTLATAVDILPESISAFGVVVDRVENQFFGCDIGIRILEFAQ